MEIFILIIDGAFVGAFQFQTGIAGHLGIEVDAVRKQFSRKGYYKKGNIYVYKDYLR